MQRVALNNVLWLLCHFILTVAPAAAKHARAMQALKSHPSLSSADTEVVVASDSTLTPPFLDSPGKGGAIVASDGTVTMPLPAVPFSAGVQRHEKPANGQKLGLVRAEMLTPSSALQRTGSSATFMMLGDNLHMMAVELDELTKLRRELQKQVATSKDGQPEEQQPNTWEAKLKAIGNRTGALEAKLHLHTKTMVKLGLMDGELDKLEQTKEDIQPQTAAERLQSIDKRIVKLQGKLQHQAKMMKQLEAMDDEIDKLEQSKKDKTGSGSTKAVEGPSATKTGDTEGTGDKNGEGVKTSNGEETGDKPGAGVKTSDNEETGAGVKTGDTEGTKGNTTAETTDTNGDTTEAGGNATAGKTTPEDKPTATGGEETVTPEVADYNLTGILDGLKSGTSAVGVSIVVMTLLSLVFSGNFD